MEKNRDVLPIFFAVDNNYAPFLSVVIESIKANSSMDYIYKSDLNICYQYINSTSTIKR